MARIPLNARSMPPMPSDPALMEEDPLEAGPPPPMFGGAAPPMGMGGAPGGMPPMAGAGMASPMGMGGSPFPSTNPALVAQLLGPLLAAQQQDDQRLQQQQMQSVIVVLASKKKTDEVSADAATAPAPMVEDPMAMPPQG